MENTTVYKLEPRGFAANCYLLTEDGASAVAVDPATPDVAERARRLGLSVRFALLTHGHFDHVGGCAVLRAAGAKIGCPEGERELAERGNLARELGGYTDFPPVRVDFTFRGGDVLTLAGMEIAVIATPGHTAGGATYLAGGELFTGDTLFAGSVGRTDLPTGDEGALIASVGKLLALGGDYPVRPGHGEDTSLSRERRFYGEVRP